MNQLALTSHFKQLRIKADYTQLYMAKQLGSMDEDYYAKIESNKKQLKVCCALRIAHVFNLSLITLLQKTGYECFTPPVYF